VKGKCQGVHRRRLRLFRVDSQDVRKVKRDVRGAAGSFREASGQTRVRQGRREDVRESAGGFRETSGQSRDVRKLKEEGEVP
jgi:hypothetical protein